MQKVSIEAAVQSYNLGISCLMATKNAIFQFLGLLPIVTILVEDYDNYPSVTMTMTVYKADVTVHATTQNEQERPLTGCSVVGLPFCVVCSLLLTPFSDIGRTSNQPKKLASST